MRSAAPRESLAPWISVPRAGNRDRAMMWRRSQAGPRSLARPSRGHPVSLLRMTLRVRRHPGRDRKERQVPRITTEGISNFGQSFELPLMAQQGKEVHWPPKHRVSGVAAPGQEHLLTEPVPVPEKEAKESSAGISSSRSAKRPAKNGGSAQATGSSSQSPAPTTELRSSQDPQASPAPSSTAPSASGSTRKTGSSR